MQKTSTDKNGDTKRCTKCALVKFRSDFYRSTQTGDGRHPHCRACIKSARKLFYSKNSAKILVQKATYQSSKKSQIAEYQAKFYAKNRKAKIAASTAYASARRKVDVEYKLSLNLRNRLYMAIRRNYKSGSAVADLGCSVADLKLYLESKFTPGMTWDTWGPKGWHIDHITPLSAFDLRNRDQLKTACHFSNLQPMWARDNISKGNRL